jgi:hypothetical protein
VNRDTRGKRRRFAELEVMRSAQILEQREPGPEGGRLDHEPILVDQPEPRERLVERGAAVRNQVLAPFALETPDLLTEIASGDSCLGPVGALQGL